MTRLKGKEKSKKQSLRLLLILIILLAVVGLLFVGYQKYAQETERKERIRAQEQQKEELRHVIQQFKDIESALKVGLNNLQYNERLVNIRIEMDKFTNKYIQVKSQSSPVYSFLSRSSRPMPMEKTHGEMIIKSR